MGRPRLALVRPDDVLIRDEIVQCQHVGCQFVSGPYLSRDETVQAAIRHVNLWHRKDPFWSLSDDAA